MSLRLVTTFKKPKTSFREKLGGNVRNSDFQHFVLSCVNEVLFRLLLASGLGLCPSLALALGLLGGSLVELVEDLGGDTVEQLLGVDTKQAPCKVKRLVNGSRLVLALANELALELLQEFERQLVLSGQGLLTNDSLHGCSITTNSVLRVQLVRNITVILSGHALTNGRLHQTRERRQHVDGRVDTTVVESSVNEDLALGNVTCQIGNRGNHVDRELPHERLKLLEEHHSKQKDQIVGEVKEEGGTLQTAVLLEIAGEETSGFQVNTHSTEDNGEVLLVAIVDTLIGDTLLLDKTSLSANLGGDFVVRQTGGGEDGDLLSSGNRVHGVDGRDTSRNAAYLLDIDAGSTLEDLLQSLTTVTCRIDLTRALSAIGKGEGDDLVVSREFDLLLSADKVQTDSSLGYMTTHIVEDDEGTVDAADGVVSNSGHDRVR
ncbi:hypothetical protein HG530_004358 [Fusarium avenaceum]|nr:hypothetical protein HG530_004358 [Fusarium avenaceum]